MFFGCSDAQFMIAAIGDHHIEHAFHIFQFNRTISNAACAGHDFQQRLEPMHAARAVAHDFDRYLALGGGRSDCACDFVGAASDRRGVPRDVDAERAHRSTSARRPSSFLASRRATTLPSIIADGETEQSPRQ